ncbi:MAG: type II secretion system F family protein [Candidatus Paceibacterota bacterium]|jgi:type II secretory pathway component PulF
MQEIKTTQESFLDKLLLIGSKDEKNFIIENLSIMLGAGLSIPSALTSILNGLRNKALIKIVKRVIKDMDEGSSLYNALAKTTLLPPYALSLIKIGEESGNLTQNLQVVALQQQKEDTLNSKLHSAMIYPILVLSITVVVGLGVAWFILPNLAKVFANLKLELPLITQILISFANLLSRQGYWLVPALIVGLFLIIYFVFFNRRTNHIGQYLLFILPMTRRLIVNLELSRLGYVLSSLLAAGIPIKETVKLLEESSGIYRYKEFYHYLGEGFESGNSFKTSFNKYPKIDRLIPPPIQQVIISGEQSGKLSSSLLLVSNRFDQKTEESIKNLPIVLEPVFLVIIWVGVLGVALAVILPIYSLVGGLNNSPTNSIQRK